MKEGSAIPAVWPIQPDSAGVIAAPDQRRKLYAPDEMERANGETSMVSVVNNAFAMPQNNPDSTMRKRK